MHTEHIPTSLIGDEHGDAPPAFRAIRSVAEEHPERRRRMLLDVRLEDVAAVRRRSSRGSAPITVSTCFPSLKNMIVGIDRTLKRTAVFWLESVSSFATLSLPERSSR